MHSILTKILWFPEISFNHCCFVKKERVLCISMIIKGYGLKGNGKKGLNEGQGHKRLFDKKEEQIHRSCAILFEENFITKGQNFKH